MIVQYVILTVLWALYGVLHSIFAAGSFKQMIIRNTGLKINQYRFIYNLFAFVSLASLLYYQFIFPADLLFAKSSVISITGWFIFAVGIIVMLICIRKY